MSPETLDLLRRILELNESIAKQNALLMQALMLPQMIIRSDTGDLE